MVYTGSLDMDITFTVGVRKVCIEISHFSPVLKKTRSSWPEGRTYGEWKL